MMLFLNSHELPMTTSVAHDDVLADVAAAADMTILADPRRSFQDRALLDDRSAPMRTTLLMNTATD